MIEGIEGAEEWVSEWEIGDRESVCDGWMGGRGEEGVC